MGEFLLSYVFSFPLCGADPWLLGDEGVHTLGGILLFPVVQNDFVYL